LDLQRLKPPPLSVKTRGPQEKPWKPERTAKPPLRRMEAKQTAEFPDPNGLRYAGLSIKRDMGEG